MVEKNIGLVKLYSVRLVIISPVNTETWL